METKLQEALKKANDEVEKAGISDPELKKIAFSKAVDFYLHREEDTVKQDGTERSSNIEQANFWDSFSVATGIEIRTLKDVYSIKNDQILLVTSMIPGKLKVDRQRSFAALILFAYHDGLGYEWISSKLLAEAAKHSRLYDSSKFAKNLRFDWFRLKGIKKGLEYKLSGPGINRAKDLLVNITK